MLPGPKSVRDSIFIFVIIVLSGLPGLRHLGFYSDDWGYVATLVHVAEAGPLVMIRALAKTDPTLTLRPVQLLCLVAEFKIFGANAVPYHFLILACLGLVSVVLYRVVSGLAVNRGCSLAIALVFGLLPQYSTDRFWISSQQAVLCMLFALIGIGALLRAIDPKERREFFWFACAAGGFVLSILTYEVALGVIAATLTLAAWLCHRKVDWPADQRRRRLAGILLVAAPLLVLGLFKISRQQRYVLHHHIPKFLLHFEKPVWQAMVEAVRFIFWNCVLRLPHVLAALFQEGTFTAGSVAISAVIFVGVAAYLWRAGDRVSVPDWKKSWLMVGAGFLLFALGYLLFFVNPGSSFETAGLNNRVAIASSLGSAFVVVGVVSLACGWVGFRAGQRLLFSIAIGMVCGAYCLVVNGISFYWTSAAGKQMAILHSLAESGGHALPQGSEILLDGFCRYDGPAVVFETDWDTAGAIQLALGNASLTGDVISPETRFDASGIETTIYGEPEGRYAYGDRLYVYNVGMHALTKLSSRTTAMTYLAKARNGTCPEGREGDGVQVY